MIEHRTIPIQPEPPSGLNDAVRLAVQEIAGVVDRYVILNNDPVRTQHVATVVAGLWLGRINNYSQEDDFWHLCRDVLAHLQTGGGRSQVSDSLAYFFSGFMPTYGMARSFVNLLQDKAIWRDIEAFMHFHGYGNARAYIQEFDWKAGQRKAQEEIKAWAGLLLTQIEDAQIPRGVYAETAPPVVLAFVGDPKQFMPKPPTPPAQPSVTPRTPPTITPPVTEPTPTGPGWRVGVGLLQLLKAPSPLLVFVLLMSIPGNVGQKDTETEFLQKVREEEEKQRYVVKVIEQQILATVNQTNNDCLPQTEINKLNGAKCEIDGYEIMEHALKYKRLVNPPKGRGLDGLFEKLSPQGMPQPMPEVLTAPEPGVLMFIPAESKPPARHFDFVGKAAGPVYPKFVVFEAKNVAKPHGEDDPERIKKTTKQRLHNTCDGRQLSVRWTTRRIPQALERQYPKGNFAQDKGLEIFLERYARWLFICLPGPVGSNKKLYVLIDVVESKMDLESTSPKEKKSKKEDISQQSEDY